MVNIELDLLDKYAERHTAKESDLLYKINRETHLEVYQPNMMSGHVQGHFLSIFSKLLQPKKIVEIGTFTGYAALCLADGLTNSGILHTIEINDELAERCQSYFDQSKKKEQIQLHIGNALDILPNISKPIDLVFIDGDKPNYANYFDLVIDKVPKGGFILADNVLYHNQVLLPVKQQSKNAHAITLFNKKVNNDPRVSPLLLPLRDGLLILEKL